MPWKYSCTASIIIAAVCLIVLLSSTITSLIPKQIFSELSQGSAAPLLGDQIKVASNAANNGSRVTAVDNLAGTLTIVTVSNNGTFLPGATYSITPNPVSGSGIYVVKDDGPADTNKVSAGVITISGLQQGRYIVTQVNAPNGYSKDKLSKIVQLGTSQNFATATFTSPDRVKLNNDNNSNSNNSNNSQFNRITYNAKFECGSIVGVEGPLRPGHYDTDISIFNRQDYTVKILWNAIINEGKNTNLTIKSMPPQTSVGITCKDIRQHLNVGNNTNELVEGFVVIRADLNAEILDSLSSKGSATGIAGLNKDQINLLDVQVFYTANALETLPREVLVSKIVFSIVNDTTSTLPSSLRMKPLDVTLHSQLNEISDPETQVKNILSQKYHLSSHEVAGLTIKIIDVSVVVDSMIDDHAISSYLVTPQIGT
jgi:Prealbumin-like fold domain